MKILITGGCGFIGTNLIAYLKKENPRIGIRVLDNFSVGARDDLGAVAPFIEKKLSKLDDQPKGIEFVAGDIVDYETCLKCCEGIDTIVHLAASTGVPTSVENPKLDMEANVIGTLNMLEAARERGVERFVFASSSAPIGEAEPPIHEEKAPRPVSPYGASKLAGEGYCSAYARTFGLKTVSLRFGNVYGPRSTHKNSVVAKFFKQALYGETLEIYGDGNQTRDFIYIDDLIQAIMLSLGAETSGEVFQIATYKETTVNEIANKVKALVENGAEKKVDVIYSNPRIGDMRRNYSDISKAKRILGYEPGFDLNSGLKHTYEYFKLEVNG